MQTTSVQTTPRYSLPARDTAPVHAEFVSKSFRQGAVTITAVDDVCLRVGQGEFVAVMGASGSGKSTLLHLLAGLTSPDGGRILVEGQDMADLSDAQLTKFRRRRIGLVFQAYNLIPTLSAEDNIHLPATYKEGLSERLEAMLKRLGLVSRRSHRPDALSGGEQQRVAIARALITEPAVVLADEPTGSLDSTTGESICRLLRGLCDDEGRAIVVVTHEASVASWAQRVAVLKDGRQIGEFKTNATGDWQSLQASYLQAIRSAS
jgi:putative ABC transport system ATP-binding protein